MGSRWCGDMQAVVRPSVFLAGAPLALLHAHAHLSLQLIFALVWLLASSASTRLSCSVSCIACVGTVYIRVHTVLVNTARVLPSHARSVASRCTRLLIRLWVCLCV